MAHSASAQGPSTAARWRVPFLLVPIGLVLFGIASGCIEDKANATDTVPPELPTEDTALTPLGTGGTSTDEFTPPNPSVPSSPPHDAALEPDPSEIEQH